jgi:hypothetical protein
MNRIEEYNIDPCPEHGFDGVEYIERTDAGGSFLKILCDQCPKDRGGMYINAVHWKFVINSAEKGKGEMITEWNVKQGKLRRDNENK